VRKTKAGAANLGVLTGKGLQQKDFLVGTAEKSFGRRHVQYEKGQFVLEKSTRCRAEIGSPHLGRGGGAPYSIPSQKVKTLSEDGKRGILSRKMGPLSRCQGGVRGGGACRVGGGAGRGGSGFALL